MNRRHPIPARQRLAVAIAAALLSTTAAAATPAADRQTGHKSDAPMPEMEVIGKRLDDVSKMTGTVVLVDREQLELIQPLSNEDALRRLPGINTKSEEESAVVSNVGIRGLSSSETKSLILEDGAPVAPGLFIGNTRYFNPRIQRVESIEVLKGSASLRYGPSTIGGVINYRTKTPDDGVRMSVRTGSFATREATVEAGGRTRSGDAFAGVVATYAESDGFMDKGYEMSDVMAKAGVRLNDQHALGLKFSWYDNDANISYRGLLLDDYHKGRTYNPAPDDYLLSDRTGVDLNHEWTPSERATLKTLVYWSETTRDYWRYNVDTAASNAAGRWVYTDTLNGNNRSFERYGVETRLTLEHALFGLENEAEFGLRFMTEESDDRRVRATRASDRSGLTDQHVEDSADSVAGYVQNRFVINDRLAVTPGLRVESYEQERVELLNNNASADTSNTEILPGVGATYALGDSTQLYGGVYKAFSPASNGVALDNLTDQNLDGERSVNYEVGVRGNHGLLNYELAAFYMDFENQVVTGNSNPLLSQSNAGETRHGGFELVLGYEIGGGFSVDGNATWVPESEFRTGDNKGNRIPYSPEYLANLALNYRANAFSAMLSAHYNGSQYGDPTNQRDLPTTADSRIWGGKIPAYTVLDLTAQYEFNERLTVFGGVKNLGDKRYITGLRQGIYVGPERSVEAGVRFRL